VVGTAIVIFATYLYSNPERKRSRPGPIQIANYEKTTIGQYTPSEENPPQQLQLPSAQLESIKSAGLSTSRPSSPLRHHSRVGSSRGKVKRDD